jgi:hypothetical protein
MKSTRAACRVPGHELEEPVRQELTKRLLVARSERLAA